MSAQAKFVFSIILFTLVWAPPTAALYGADRQTSASQGSAAGGTGQTVEYLPMPAPGKKVPLGNGYYLIYGFDKKPKLGTAIMKVEIFTRNGKKDTSFAVAADTGMPSMGGAHETGERPFMLSKKGDYLLPINIVMPGDWETRITVMKTEKVIFRGRYNFHV